MHPNYIKDSLEQWFFDVIDFTKYILQEKHVIENETELAASLLTLISRDSTESLFGAVGACNAIFWITEYQKFKSSYGYYTKDFNNMVLNAINVHVKDMEIAENTAHSLLTVANPITIHSYYLNKDIQLDTQFLDDVMEFFKRWNDKR